MLQSRKGQFVILEDQLILKFFFLEHNIIKIVDVERLLPPTGSCKRA